MKRHPPETPSLPSEPAGVSPADDAWPADPSAHSPLWLVTTEPTLNAFVMDLQRLRAELLQAPTCQREVCFSRDRLEAVRAAFAAMILNGEETLHRLSELLCDTFLTSFQIQSAVVGEMDSTGERFTLLQNLTVDDLYSTTDLDLGTRQLNKLRYYDGQGWSRASLVANTVEYQPTEPNPHAVHRIISRIKAEEEIWNKVVDELFELDRLVHRDKKLRHLSRYVKDIFGLKIVVGEVGDVYRVQQALTSLQWADDTLRRVQVEPGAATRRLAFVEVKDYVAQEHRKRSGWGALKSVVRWGGKTFEIQIQPLRNYLREQEVLTRESHRSFRASREQARSQVAEQVPLFRFYRDLLRWLFLTPHLTPPAYPGLTVRLVHTAPEATLEEDRYG